MRPSAFTGPVLIDLAVWGGAGEVFGLAIGYVYGEAYNFVKQPISPKDILAVAGLSSARLTVFALLVVGTGHILVSLID